MKNYDTQREEFKRADEFAVQLHRLERTPIVDDDYPEVRHAYEGALNNLIAAMKANDRFVPGNRYGVTA